MRKRHHFTEERGHTGAAEEEEKQSCEANRCRLCYVSTDLKPESPVINSHLDLRQTNKEFVHCLCHEKLRWSDNLLLYTDNYIGIHLTFKRKKNNKIHFVFVIYQTSFLFAMLMMYYYL